jgi:transposase
LQLDGGMPTEALIIHVLISKYCDFPRLYRRSQMLARQGVVLDRSLAFLRLHRSALWCESSVILDKLVGRTLNAHSFSMLLVAPDGTPAASLLAFS